MRVENNNPKRRKREHGVTSVPVEKRIQQLELMLQESRKIFFFKKSRIGGKKRRRPCSGTERPAGWC